MPKKNTVNDFRLTLPDGGSLYYNNSSGEWILAAKSKVTIGGQSNISETSVPNPSSSKEAARKDDETIINATTDSTLITWLSTLVTLFNAHVHQVVSLGAPTAPPSTSTPPTVIGSAPSSLTGKINAGSDKVFLN
jgi:hypothetical protein